MARGQEEGKSQGGRPSKYENIDLDQVKKLAMKSWTDVEMADFFEVDISTWHRWKGRYSEFRDSLNDWKAEADSRVERSLYERAMGYSHPEDKIFNGQEGPVIVPTRKHYPPDPTSMIFWLKNRQPEKWRDKPAEEEQAQEQVSKIQIEVVGANVKDSSDTASS